MNSLTVVIPCYNEENNIQVFYYLIRKLSGLEIVDGARDFKIINRPMLEALLILEETNIL